MAQGEAGNPHRQMIMSLADKDAAYSRGHHGLGLIVPVHLMEASKSWTITADSADRTYIVVKTAAYAAIGMYLTVSLSTAKWDEVLERLRRHITRNEDKPVIIIGDLNARTTASGDKITTTRGRQIAAWMEEMGMQLIKPSVPTWTFQSIGEGHRSIVDVVWGNIRALNSAAVTANVLQEADRAGSDHRPVMATLMVARQPAVSTTRIKTGSYRLSKSTDTAERFQQAIASRLGELQADSRRMLEHLMLVEEPAETLHKKPWTICTRHTVRHSYPQQ